MSVPTPVIRPVVMTDEEAETRPRGHQDARHAGQGLPSITFAMTVSALDCTGCGSCVDVCPGMKGNKALTMKPLDTQAWTSRDVFDYGLHAREPRSRSPSSRPPPSRAASSSSPCFEFSGACAGCGETPYAKLVTQLFGDRMYIANATGCSSIWGGSAPSTPYTVNKQGRGPAWANSLFEDNAEFGYGMNLAVGSRARPPQRTWPEPSPRTRPPAAAVSPLRPELAQPPHGRPRALAPPARPSPPPWPRPSPRARPTPPTCRRSTDMQDMLGQEVRLDLRRRRLGL